MISSDGCIPVTMHIVSLDETIHPEALHIFLMKYSKDNVAYKELLSILRRIRYSNPEIY
jgi:hypothetical protein